MAFARAVSKELNRVALAAGGFEQKTVSHLKLVQATPGMVMFFPSLRIVI